MAPALPPLKMKLLSVTVLSESANVDPELNWKSSENKPLVLLTNGEVFIPTV